MTKQIAQVKNFRQEKQSRKVMPAKVMGRTEASPGVVKEWWCRQSLWRNAPVKRKVRKSSAAGLSVKRRKEIPELEALALLKARKRSHNASGRGSSKVRHVEDNPRTNGARSGLAAPRTQRFIPRRTTTFLRRRVATGTSVRLKSPRPKRTETHK